MMFVAGFRCGVASYTNKTAFDAVPTILGLNGLDIKRV